VRRESYPHALAAGITADSAAPLGLNAAAREWARLTGTPRPHRSTLLRWATRGCRGVRLAAERAGNSWAITPAALAEFHRQLNDRPAVTVPAGPVRSAQIAQANDEFDRLVGDVMS
jgi:hypothetical protein